MAALRKHASDLKWLGLEGASRFPISLDISTPNFKETCEMRDQVVNKLNTDDPKQFVGLNPLPQTGTHYFATRRLRNAGIGVGVVESKLAQAETSSA